MPLRPRMWLLALPAVMAVGCAQVQAVSADGDHLGRGVAHVQTAFVGPFDGLTDWSPLEIMRFQVAQDLLIARCMRTHSFTYLVPRLPAPADGTEVGNPYGIVSLSAARKWGYGISDNYLIDQEDQRIGSGSQPEMNRPGFDQALIGTSRYATKIHVPDGSIFDYNSNACVTTANDNLYGPTWYRVYYAITALAIMVSIAVQALPAWHRATRAWSQCVRATYAGDFANPNAAEGAVNNLVSEKLANLRPGAAFTARLKSLRAGEVRLATVDAQCQATVGLAAVATKLQQAAEQHYELKYARDMGVFAADLRHAQETANALLKQA
jgi:hypothetical protein